MLIRQLVALKYMLNTFISYSAKHTEMKKDIEIKDIWFQSAATSFTSYRERVLVVVFNTIQISIIGFHIMNNYDNKMVWQIIYLIR